MRFSYKELLTVILSSGLENEGIIELLDRIQRGGFITPGFYLRLDEESGLYECWYRNVDEDGMTEHGRTNYSAEQVVGLYARSIQKNNMKY